MSWAIRNPDPNRPLAGKVDLILLKRNPDLTWSEAGEGAAYREGDPLGLRIVNRLDRPVYATILDFGLSHAISQVFPVEGSSARDRQVERLRRRRLRRHPAGVSRPLPAG